MPETLTRSSSALPCGVSTPHVTEVGMNVCELQLEDAAGERAFAAARWALFSFHEIRHVCPLGVGGQIAVLYDGEPAVDAWLDALQTAGFSASSVEAPTDESREAA